MGRYVALRSQSSLACLLGPGLEGVLETLLEETPDVTVAQSVVDELSVATTRDDMELPEGAELVRHGGLAHPQDTCQVRRAELAQRQRVDDPHPCGVAKHLEGLCDDAGALRGENLISDIRPAAVVTYRSCHNN